MRHERVRLHYRSIARQMTDAQAREGLLELAGEYETFVEKMADKPPESQP